jgi:hypothetical protein
MTPTLSSLDSVRKSLLEAQGHIPCNDEDAHDRMRNSIEIVERIMLAEVRREPITAEPFYRQ